MSSYDEKTPPPYYDDTYPFSRWTSSYRFAVLSHYRR